MPRPSSALLEQEDIFSVGVAPDSFPSIASIVSLLCWDLAHGPLSLLLGEGLGPERVAPSVITAFMGGGIAPILVEILQQSVER